MRTISFLGKALHNPHVLHYTALSQPPCSHSEMDDVDCPLAEFYYYTVGDETTYNQELNDLFVCYTLTRGLQFCSDRPRRRALPLEIILRIIRYAGFIDPKPDLTLTAQVMLFSKSLLGSGTPSVWYMTAPLNRVQLASMARIQLVNVIENAKHKIMPYDSFHGHPTRWAFIPLGMQEKAELADCGSSVIAALYPCTDDANADAAQHLTPGVIIGDTFGPDHHIGKQLDEGHCPFVTVISKEPARLLIWKWWEPKF